MAASNTYLDMEDINVALVKRLITAQFPQWAQLPITPAVPQGWDNMTFRLGANMSVRLPSAERYKAQVVKEHRWLPRLAPHLPLPIPVPLTKGTPGEGYPFPWSVYRWLEGETATAGRIADLREFAAELARFLTALQQIDPAGGAAQLLPRRPACGLRCRDPPSDRSLAGQDRYRPRNGGMGSGARGHVAGPARLVPRRRRIREPAG
jgi:aminoglycoside phosphotransferase (APT) family kinase protein